MSAPVPGPVEAPPADGAGAAPERPAPVEGDRTEGARAEPTGVRAWLSVGRAVQARLKEDDGVLLAAGVAFFGLLAVFPALIAVVSIYGLVADPADVQRQVASIAETAPDQTKELIVEQLDGIVAASTTGLSFAVVVALVAALWTTSTGVARLLAAVRRAYGVGAETSVVRSRLRAVGYAVIGALVAVVVIASLAVLPAVVRTSLPDSLATALLWLRWPLLALVMVVVLAQVYRHGSSARGGWARWITPGSVLAVVLWLVASVGFTAYVSWFGSFDATYGSLGAVIVTMLWLYLSALCVLLGAYLNAELERRREAGTPPLGGAPSAAPGGEVEPSATGGWRRRWRRPPRR